MTEDTKPKSPIVNASAYITGLKITNGDPPMIEFRVGFPLNHDTEAWLAYLARCIRFGSAYVDVRSPAPTLDEAATEREAVPDPADLPPPNPDDPFPGWPKPCGKKVKIKGANAECDDGHVTTTPFGEPCNFMPAPPDPLPFPEPRCAVSWDNDPDNRCTLEEAHPGAHQYPNPPPPGRRKRGATDGDNL